MADHTRIIAESTALEERTHGLRFDLPELGDHVSGFVVRFDNQVYAYVNQCAHVPIELDWNEGDFFDLGKRLSFVCNSWRTLSASNRPLHDGAMQR